MQLLFAVQSPNVSLLWCAGHTSTVNKLQFSPDDNHLASVANDGTQVLWRFGPGTN
jgi:WD40 repeat protein